MRALAVLHSHGLALITTEPPEAPIAAAQRRLPDGRASIMLLNHSGRADRHGSRAGCSRGLWDRIQASSALPGSPAREEFSSPFSRSGRCSW